MGWKVETGGRAPKRGSLELTLEDVGLLRNKSVGFPHEAAMMQPMHGLPRNGDSATHWSAVHCSLGESQ